MENVQPHMSDDDLAPLEHPGTPCPEWCSGCDRYPDSNWNEFEDSLSRSHSTEPLATIDEPATAVYGRPARLYARSYLAQDEMATASDATTKLGAVVINMNLAVIGGGISEVNADLTADQARRIAKQLLGAAEKLDQLAAPRSR